MTQLTDLMNAVNQELADVKLLLDKLSAVPTIQLDPTLAQAISDLQASHTAITTALTPVTTAVTAPVSPTATPAVAA